MSYHSFTDCFSLFFTQIATVIATCATKSRVKVVQIEGISWGWAGVIWLYSIVIYIPLDFLKFAVRYILSGKAWNNMIDNRVCESFGGLNFLSRFLTIGL